MPNEVAERQAQYEAQKIAGVEARKTALLAKDFTEVGKNLDDLYAELSVSEIKLLNTQSESFRNRVKVLDTQGAVIQNTALIDKFRATPEGQQDAFYKALLPYQKQIIDADYDRFMALTPEQQTAELVGTPVQPAAAAQQAEAAAAQQAEADRLAAEAVTPPVIPAGADEDLYDGIEKLGDGSYKLTVDPGDGTPVEVFYGVSQKECFKALRKSKANATKELRRRRNALKITDELKAMTADVINYPPLIEPISLTPDEIFSLTKEREKLEDDLTNPAKVLTAKKRLREIDQKLELASLTPEECEKMNAPELQSRYRQQHDTATLWLKNNTEFYPHAENIKRFQELMSGLNWAVTISNMDKAFVILKEQGVLLDPPEDESSQTPPAQPAYVVPVAVVPAPVTPAPTVASVPTPVATPGALPATPERLLRPGSSSTAAMPTRRIGSVSTGAPKVVLTVEMYNATPASEVKQRYQRDPMYKAAVDLLIKEGKI
jgi:hypothetical protein